MFTTTPIINDEKIVKSYLGVDIQNYHCQKLIPNALYTNYKKQQLHFPIGAIQKGLKPHTHIGIKRILKRNASRKLKQQQNKDYIKPLIPKSPEQICVKALRTSFRNELEQTHIESEGSIAKRQHVPKVNSRAARRQKRQIRQARTETGTLSKRKQHQRQRRHQLILLVKANHQVLSNHFGHDRMIGYGRCPKISRNEIKAFLALQTTQQTIKELNERPSRYGRDRMQRVMMDAE